jgi:hypothetical protein
MDLGILMEYPAIDYILSLSEVSEEPVRIRWRSLVWWRRDRRPVEEVIETDPSRGRWRHGSSSIRYFRRRRRHPADRGV